MGKEARLLDHVSHLQPQRWGVDSVRVGAVNQDAAAVGIDEPVDHAQRRRLAATRGPDQNACLAVGDVQREVEHRVRAAGELFAHVLQADHGSSTVIGMEQGPFLAYVDPWINWDWLSTHISLVLGALGEHIELTAIALGAGLLIAIHPGVAARLPAAISRGPLGFSAAFSSFLSLGLFCL